MKKTITFFAGSLSYILLAVLLSGYGNIRNHRDINEVIVDEFTEKSISNSLISAYENYVFDLDETRIYGNAITKRGTFSATTGRQRYTPKEWIIHGGYSADEPELHASFRHFYDPKRKAGDRYLHDHLEDLDFMLYNFTNPKVDHVNWALSNPGHEYNWNNGIAAIKKALEEMDDITRNEHMAFAWRALGETLHMIADMGCPAHVRDDSHPSLFSGKYEGIYKYLGSPDYYEETCEAHFGDMMKSLVGNYGEDIQLQEIFKQASSVKRIAHELASWTNTNFFTNQTIYGPGIDPIIHPLSHHTSPSLFDCRYEESSYTYTKTIAREDVVMCSDKDYLIGKIWKKRGYPKFTYSAAYDQASVLFPQIKEAGIHVMMLMIPKLSVELERLTPEGASGHIVHQTNEVFVNSIEYAGDVNIYTSEGKKVGTVLASGGKFDGDLNIRRRDYEGDEEFYAEIEFGGIKVKSLPYKGVGSSDDHDSKKYEFAYNAHFYGSVSYGTIQSAGQIIVQIGQPTILLDGEDGHYSGTFSFDDPNTFLDIVAQGSISFDASDSEITNLEIDMEWKKLSTGWKQNETFKISSIPQTAVDGKLRTFYTYGYDIFTNRFFVSSTNGQEDESYLGPDPGPIEGWLYEDILIYLRERH
ncbi:MAG: hypothetical protein KAH17_09425 [Bacteroidales bacterium]|nr:hypothetical protein [Bacteroidales bacterium]